MEYRVESHGSSYDDSNADSPIVTSPFTPVSGNEHAFYDTSGLPLNGPLYPMHSIAPEYVPSPAYYGPSEHIPLPSSGYDSEPHMLNPAYMISTDTLSTHASSLTLRCDQYFYPEQQQVHYSPGPEAEPPFQQDEIEALERTFTSMKRVSASQKLNHASTFKRSLQSIDAWFTERRSQDKKRRAMAQKSTTRLVKKNPDGKTTHIDYTLDPQQERNKLNAQQSLDRYLRGEFPPAGPPPTPFALQIPQHHPIQIPIQTQHPQQMLAPGSMVCEHRGSPAPSSIMVPVSLPRTPEAVEPSSQQEYVRHEYITSQGQGWNQYGRMVAPEASAWGAGMGGAMGPGYGGMQFH
ncbi:hypothetical protein BJ508DRAFT_329745 [Ascobolus immersus RN42]|uniref:Homeobox domain-containing protein n=1 Tax=Ascobolus immersus RN42 TaxID=1160509 RepID=A0A3N4HZT0_ASCIM|nr:hypothetical protein BJ508DRAFT_329745 [Ascobolus immersus RN42]